MDNLMQANIDDKKKSAQKAAEKDARDREIAKIEENKFLKQQLIIKQREVQEMRRERDLVLKQNKSFKLNLQVNKEGILEYQVVNSSLENKIKQLKEEVESQKMLIQKNVMEQAKGLEFLRLQDTSRREELAQNLKEMRSLAKQKGDELRRVKGLAEIIVDQRSDIESFFLEALRKIKEQMQAKQISMKRKPSFQSKVQQPAFKLPELNKKHKTSQSEPQIMKQQQQEPQKLIQDKVDISELALEEKDKLLRILFRKMNLGVQPQNWDDPR